MGWILNLGFVFKVFFFTLVNHQKYHHLRRKCMKMFTFSKFSKHQTSKSKVIFPVHQPEKHFCSIPFGPHRWAPIGSPGLRVNSQVPVGRGRYFAKCAKNVSWEKKKAKMEGRKIRRYTYGPYGSQIIGENRVFHIEHGLIPCREIIFLFSLREQ